MKLKKIIIMALCLSLVMTCGVFLAACNKGGDNGDNNKTQIRDDTKWFSEEELAKKGLSALPAPTGLSGDMNSYLYWYNDGYSFHQACPNEDIFYENVEKYFAYFNEKFDGRFGTIDTRSYKYSPSTNEYYYNILKKTDLADYFSNNPSSLYKFYYVTDKTLEDGYLKADAVWTFEIRYEFDTTKNTYLFKIFIENAGKTRNGIYTNHYRMV